MLIANRTKLNSLINRQTTWSWISCLVERLRGPEMTLRVHNLASGSSCQNKGTIAGHWETFTLAQKCKTTTSEHMKINPFKASSTSFPVALKVLTVRGTLVLVWNYINENNIKTLIVTWIINNGFLLAKIAYSPLWKVILQPILTKKVRLINFWTRFLFLPRSTHSQIRKVEDTNTAIEWQVVRYQLPDFDFNTICFIKYILKHVSLLLIYIFIT